MSLFTDHNYTHESLTTEQIDKIVAGGDPVAIKVALYALTLEGVLHQIASHNPPKGEDRGVWARRYAGWAIHPEDRPRPSSGEF